MDNLLRACPVLDVTDNRRLTLWVAFGLTLLGGIGLDHLGRTRRLGRVWPTLWIVVGIILLAAACGIRRLEPALRSRAVSHYQQAAKVAGSDRGDERERADRQVRATLDFIPRYYGLAAGELLVLWTLAFAGAGPAARAEGSARSCWSRPPPSSACSASG